MLKALCLYIVMICLCAIPTLFFAWLLCDIDPEKYYSWYHGIWHGMFFIPNLIRSLFGDAIYKANHYTDAYNVWWWIMTIMSCCGVVFGKSR